MIRILLLVLSFSVLMTAGLAEAAPYRRLVNFEWEPIEGATSYEIELKPVKAQGETKTFNFKVKESAWNGRLSVGKYMMRLRSRDYRGVPGDWSDPSEFNVGLEPAVLKSPAPKTKIDSKEDSTVEVDFQWDPVGGAEKYHFELNSEDGQTKIAQDLKDNHIKLRVPVAMNYNWKVSSVNNEGMESESASVADFNVQGKAIAPVQIDKPESQFVRDLKWKRPEHVESYDITLLKYNDAGKKWEKYKSFENYKEDSLTFDQEWPGGKYELVVRAKGTMREGSPPVKLRFAVKEGTRSADAEQTALVRKSVDRFSGWYGIASYLVTNLKYSGSNPEHNSATSYSALGGTGRLGVGWLSNRSNWGFLGIVDLSGITYQGKIQTFASAELNGVYRMVAGERGELRFQFGPYYKELPETYGDPFTNTSATNVIKSAGPHIGAEYWYAFNPKLGFQVNAHLYSAMMALSTPNGQPLEPSVSTQFGLLGSYRFTPKTTGLIGVTRREDKVSYKAVPSASNFAVDGDVNESTITGTYLNLIMEWSF